MYATYIFPRLMDWVLRGERFQAQRQRLLAAAHGNVVEIGFGTGLNLPHYPRTVTDLYAVDPAPLLPQRVAQRVAQALFPVHLQRERLGRQALADLRNLIINDEGEVVADERTEDDHVVETVDELGAEEALDLLGEHALDVGVVDVGGALLEAEPLLHLRFPEFLRNGHLRRRHCPRSRRSMG